MKKLLLLTTLIIVFTTSQAQFETSMGIDMGVSLTNIKAGDASKAGISIGIDFGAWHIDFASNFAKGEGEFLEFNSSQTTMSDKLKWLIMNFGYNIKICEAIVITPKIGYYSEQEIYEDPIGNPTYYTSEAKGGVQVGVDAKYFFNGVYLKLGTATKEIASVGIGFYM